MIGKRWMGRLTAALAAVCLLVPLTVTAQAQAERKTVKVAFPTQEGMSFFGHSGKVTGYNYDYLEKISEYTGWEMEYVAYPSNDGNEAVGSAIQDLTDGKVDLLGPLLKNESTEELFAFPDNSYGTVYTTLCALTTSSIQEHNMAQQPEIRVGLWQKAEVRNSEVLRFLESENYNYTITYFDSASEQQQALLDGKVDLISSVSLSPVANTRIVAQFAPRPYYFAAPKGEEALVKTLDETIAKINQTEPKLQDTLYNKYFRNVEQVFLLTDAQKQTIQSHGTLNVLCVDYDAPYVYSRKEEPTGMLVSILNDYCQEVGVEVHYSFCANRAEAEELLTENHYDLLLGLPMTSASCAELGFINSAPVMETPLALVQNPVAHEGKRLAIVRGLEEQIDTSEYDETLICDSVSDCLRAIDAGKADIAAGDRSAMLYYINDTGSNLTTSPLPGQNQNICMAIQRDVPEELLETLNSYIYSLTETELTGYLSDGNLHVYPFSPILFMRRYPVESAVVLVLCSVLLVGVVALLVTRSSRKKAALQKQHNDQLQEALQIARESNESKTTFLSNMSHDIRTPMNAVIGFSTLLAREPDNSVKVKEYSRKITAASNHLLGLINDILDISKIESGKVTLNQSVFSINELLESINVVVRPMAGAKRQSFQIQMEPTVHELFLGDKTRINQILINLLSNAVKYTPMGGHITFKIEDKGVKGNFEKIRFQVIDDGYGVSEDFQKVIFEPFTRAESSTINKEVGTGLGLAITKNIVDLMGGTIELQSELNKGSTFTVELPLRIPHEEQDENFWANHGVTKMLLVDDDKEVCDHVKANMEGSGVHIDAVFTGKAAVELAKKAYESHQEYSAIVLDWQMPEMDGLEVARAIRKAIPIDTPILFLTSYDWSEIETQALEIDVDGFLAKPFTVTNLKEKLMEVERFKNAVSDNDTNLDMHGMHFLVAEDNQLNAEILEALLQSEGATCDISENGELAVERFCAKPEGTYDAVLMDIMMPVLNGYDATKRIRTSNHPEAQTIPVIAMTANAFVKDVQDALDSGMNAHIAKPINLKTLKNTLAVCLRK